MCSCAHCIFYGSFARVGVEVVASLPSFERITHNLRRIFHVGFLLSAGLLTCRELECRMTQCCTLGHSDVVLVSGRTTITEEEKEIIFSTLSSVKNIQ